MEVLVGKNAGFCGGVEFTVKNANDLLEEGSIYCLGEIVHNKNVINELENKGMITVENIAEVPDNSRVIFRAHGEPPITYKKAEEKNLIVNDLTCSIVKNIHQKVENAKKDSFIIIIGVKNHPEVIGTKGFSGENSFVIESSDDILDCYMEYEKTYLGKIYVCAQTTFSSKKFDDLIDEIDTNFCEAELVIEKTICNTTENRQLETLKISKECDTIFVIGGQNSSNTRKLYEIAIQNCKNVFYVGDINDVKQLELNKNDKIGILAGASTPKNIIENIENYLKGM